MFASPPQAYAGPQMETLYSLDPQLVQAMNTFRSVPESLRTSNIFWPSERGQTLCLFRYLLSGDQSSTAWSLSRK